MPLLLATGLWQQLPSFITVALAASCVYISVLCFPLLPVGLSKHGVSKEKLPWVCYNFTSNVVQGTSPCKVSFPLEGNSSKFISLFFVCSSVVFAWMFCLVCGRFSIACSLSRLIVGSFRKHSHCLCQVAGLCGLKQAGSMWTPVGGKERTGVGIPKLQWDGMESGLVEFLLIVCRT